MTNRSSAQAGGTPHDDFLFSVAATYRDWLGGHRDGDSAMEVIGNALTELRQAQEDEA
ncbi:hypothetical protein [Streptomyces violarus]|uniref:hypothetical protein n=1 Tax=Streptomyces violarus TaxID=67380 RepID=UPI0021BE642C|nr:hypothetical protein [Streptomyces violarus]MCT9145698.1 hypothetical protein [Streptomyces violarus]